MPNCLACHETYVHGGIICSNCGADLDEPVVATESSPFQLLLPVVGIERGLVHKDPTIALYVVEIDDTLFIEGAIVAVIPVKRLEIPVRIGRKDLTQNPPIRPELELGEILAVLQPGVRPVISRLHAALQLDGGRPAIKPLVDHLVCTTWVRHTNDVQLSPVPLNTVRLLEHRDVIVLGHPNDRHVTLRVVFSDP